MKIKRFNENKTENFEQEVQKYLVQKNKERFELFTSLRSKLGEVLSYWFDPQMDTDINLADDQRDSLYVSVGSDWGLREVTFKSYNVQKNLFTATYENSEYEVDTYEIYYCSELLELIEALNGWVKEQSYRYQKEMIENNQIKELDLDNLNINIEKEYPWIKGGKRTGIV
jgi:hypothetical protein